MENNISSLQLELDKIPVNKKKSNQEQYLKQVVEATTVRIKPKKSKIGRNDMCPCGSNQKYKNCCEKTLEHLSPGTMTKLPNTGFLANLDIPKEYFKIDERTSTLSSRQREVVIMVHESRLRAEAEKLLNKELKNVKDIVK